jgi:ArsR family transcriptional regulator
MSEASVAALAETFKVLGDTSRVRILDALSRGDLCVTHIASLIGLSESAVSHQLRVLRGMRLVRPRRAGRLIIYRLDDQHIVRLFEQGLQHVQESEPGAHQAQLRGQPEPAAPATAFPVSQDEASRSGR